MEIIANAVQLVAANQNVYFTDTVVDGNACISHRDDSGLVSLKGLTNQCRARYRISFGGNIAIPEGGAAGPISVAIAIDGEPVLASTMIVTPTVVDAYFNVSSTLFVDVPKGCCTTVSVRNTSAVSINVENANFIIERVA
jgi:hypothetical protein